jgi:hypothetical protein
MKIIQLTLSASSVLAAVLFAAVASAADLAGTWNISYTGPMGERKLQLVVNADGSAAVDGQATELKGDASSFVFSAKRSTDFGEITLNYTGKLEGDKLTGTVAVANMPGGAGGPPGGGAGGPPAEPIVWTGVRAQ